MGFPVRTSLIVRGEGILSFVPKIFAKDPCSLSFFLLRFPGLPRLPEEGLEVYPVLRLLRPVVVEQLLRREVPGIH